MLFEIIIFMAAHVDVAHLINVDLYRFLKLSVMGFRMREVLEQLPPKNFRIFPP